VREGGCFEMVSFVIIVVVYNYIILLIACILCMQNYISLMSNIILCEKINSKKERIATDMLQPTQLRRLVWERPTKMC